MKYAAGWSPSLPALVLMVFAPFASAGDPLLNEVTSGGAISFQVSDVGRLIEHPLVDSLRDELLDSPTLQFYLTSPDAQMGYERLEAAEQVWGCTWQEAYARLTAGGVYGKLTREAPPHLLVAFSASDEDIVAATIQLAKQAIEAQAAAEGNDASIESVEYRGLTAFKAGDGVFVAIGNRLLFANDGETLRAAADEILDADADLAEAELQPEEIGHLHVDLTALRLVPDFAAGLITPMQDPGAAFSVGGWVDVLRRYDSLSVTFTSESDGLQASVEFHDPNGEAMSALEGFWADTPEESPAPLLNLPNTIYSNSIYRDFSALWDARSELIASNVVEQMDQGDEDIAQQLAVLGLQYKPSDIIATVGPRWRFVAVRAEEGPYPDVPVTDLLPAFALVVELNDPDEFWHMISPVTRTLNLILSGEQRFTVEQQTMGDGEVTTLSVDRSPRALRQKSQTEYNFRVTYGVIHGHAVVGSTPAIVEQIAEALAAEQSAVSSLADQNTELVTERQYISGGSLAQMLDGFHDAAVRSWVLNSGVDLSEAEQEWSRIVRMVGMLGDMTSEARFEDDRFVYELTLQPQLSE